MVECSVCGASFGTPILLRRHSSSPCPPFGFGLPRVGFGTANLAGESCVRATLCALRAGYRLVDTAALYGNEAEVGQAVRQCGIPREELWVASKLHPDQHGPLAESAVRGALDRLGLNRLDLMLVHWPGTLDGRPGGEQLRRQTWRGLDRCVRQGLVRCLGVSNFELRHLRPLWEWADQEGLALPVVLQSEMHPLLQQTELRLFCARHEIVFQAYSPLGGFRSQGAVLQDPTVNRLAESCGKTAAQVALRWGLQQGVAVIPSSSNRERIVQNFGLWDFKLSEEQMEAIRAESERGVHFYWHAETVD